MKEELKKISEYIVSCLKNEVHNNKVYLVCYCNLSEKEDRPNLNGLYNYFTLNEKKIYSLNEKDGRYYTSEVGNTLNNFYFYYLKNKYPNMNDSERWNTKNDLLKYTQSLI